MRTATIGIYLLIWASIAPAETLTASQAKSHEGGRARLSAGQSQVARTATGSRGEPTFINLDAAYPRQVFTIRFGRQTETG